MGLAVVIFQVQLSIFQRESVIKPYGITDHSLRKMMAFVYCDLTIHSIILKGRALG